MTSKDREIVIGWVAARVASHAFRRYSGSMSKETAELLEAFEALAPDEKRSFTAEFLRRAIPFDSGPLDDEETAHAADSLFALLDANENEVTRSDVC